MISKYEGVNDGMELIYDFIFDRNNNYVFVNGRKTHIYVKKSMILKYMSIHNYTVEETESLMQKLKNKNAIMFMKTHGWIAR